MANIYDFNVTDAQGASTSLAKYQGKLIMVVNTASKCGFTPQYKELQSLYETWHEKGLEILAFPCNQFGQQEPGTDAEIQQFCQLNYGLTFPVLAKIDVNGDNAHPLYKHLCSQKTGVRGNDIQWNFTKFLIDQNGNVVERYEPNVNPQEISGKLETLLHSQ